MGCAPSTPGPGGHNSDMVSSSHEEETLVDAPDAEVMYVLTMKKPELADDKEFIGVSVHYLQNVFLDEVEAAGIDRDSTIYDLEDLDGPPPGAVR